MPPPLSYDGKRRRVHVLGYRCHHGAVGAFLLAGGVFLVAHDWADRWWVRDS